MAPSGRRPESSEKSGDDVEEKNAEGSDTSEKEKAAGSPAPPPASKDEVKADA